VLRPVIPPRFIFHEKAARAPLTRTVRGNAGDEVIDENFNFTNARRRSNSSISANLENLKSKFEVNEPEPVFEESMGPEEEEEKMESSSSGTSVDEGKPHKEM
jgi:hypothetical protein